MARYFLTIFFCVCLTACGSSDTPLAEGLDQAIAENQCSIPGQNNFVYEVMLDVYFWNTEIPVVDPLGFSSPEALLEAIRFRPLDNTFSNIQNAADQSQFFAEGQTVGVGVTLVFDDAGLLRIAETIAGGPAAQAGIERGGEIAAINGISISDVLAGAGISAALGPDEIGTPVQLTIRNLLGVETTFDLQKALVTIDPVPVMAMFDVNGIQVGYLNFKTFITPSFDALEAAFAAFRAAGVTELVVDMRYNGGGFVAVAEFLGDLVGGSNTDGLVYANQVFNANNADRNNTSFFEDRPEALDLSRVVFITTGSTASASELVINSLEPHVDVVLVGDTTFGKPVGSFGFNFCDKTFNPISFNTRNADDEGDYFDGLPVDCAVADDLAFPLGDPQEASLAEALAYIQNSSCSAATAVSSKQSSTQPAAQSGLRALHYVF